MLGYALCGSFCTHAQSLIQLKNLIAAGYEVQPIVSETVFATDTRFGKAQALIEELEGSTSHPVIHTVPDAEPLGPKISLDALIIAPCTGNTMAKLAAGITDTPVLMAAKAHLRNEKPLIIAVSTNDALGMNLKNIGLLMNTKNIYFVPFGQDDYIKKPLSLVAHMEEIPATIEAALKRKQIQPVVKEYSKL